ncbi:Aspartic proteinase A1 [Camellia lanceoleosa]|uniref:Aspartic proteinase A1 n=1 Tax=Camellia lanceoleosa TaxID=1840588 RepID=A0ACC0IKQ2_9ERIC|nr:Aspartic proteinase A1 [Camellia lanceoleosa]
MAFKKFLQPSAMQGNLLKFTMARGAISGFFSVDNVRVGDLLVKDQFDGILGLGFREISAGDAVPVWYNMVEQGLVKEEVFSFWLNRNADEEEGGEIVFGGDDPNHYRGKHMNVSVTKKGFLDILSYHS